MIELEDVLKPEHVRLGLEAKTPSAAVAEVLTTLRNDPAIRDWNAVANEFAAKEPPAMGHGKLGICIAHVRTGFVSRLVLGVGRTRQGIAFPNVEQPVRLFFVAAIPSAMDSEYLRIIGAIARMCSDPQTAGRLLSVEKAEDFRALLIKGERR